MVGQKVISRAKVFRAVGIGAVAFVMILVAIPTLVFVYEIATGK